MKFALVDGKRREAQPGLSAKCPVCGDAMIAKCGDYRRWHWSHLGTRTCDTWWESETEWHRAWKNRFPEGWQEIFYQSEDGEKHFADVKTEKGLVLEFQHSFLRRDERESRENFYPKMVWVVNGRRRVRDRARFFASLGAAKGVNFKPLTFSFPSNEGALLRDWTASRVPVFFDFRDLSEPGDPLLWRLNPRSPNGGAHLSPVLKTSFLYAHLKGQPLKGMDCSAVERAAVRRLIQQAPRSPLKGFERYVAMKRRTRRRFF
jgi:competence protein CoiA